MKKGILVLIVLFSVMLSRAGFSEKIARGALKTIIIDPDDIQDKQPIAKSAPFLKEGQKNTWIDTVEDIISFKNPICNCAQPADNGKELSNGSCYTKSLFVCVPLFSLAILYLLSVPGRIQSKY